MTIEDKAKKVSFITGIICMLIGFLLAFANLVVGIIFMFLGYLLFQSVRAKNTNIPINKKETVVSTVVSGYSYENSQPESEESVESKKRKLSEDKILDSVKFRYKDIERVVDVYTGKKGDDFEAFCHTTGMVLTFYFERISNYEVVRVSTGEKITPMEWRYQLQGTKVAEQAVKKEKEKIRRDKEAAKINKENTAKLSEANNSWLRLTEPKPEVKFEGMSFALGGYFKSGNTDESKEKVVSRGGVVKSQPSGKVDYIVVNQEQGVNASYEKAIKNLIDREKSPVIISEEYWLESME